MDVRRARCLKNVEIRHAAARRHSQSDLQLPLFQEGLETGVFTEEDLATGFASFDKNRNGVLCFKHTPAGELPHPYLIIDDLPGNRR